MTLLVEVRRLLGFSDYRQAQCARGLDKLSRSLAPLEREQGETELRIKGLHDLLLSHRAEALHMSHSELLGLLRRQAVIRRQISNAVLERDRVASKLQHVTLEIEQLQQRRAVLHKKHVKYQGLEQRLLAERRSHQWRQEENDIEELLVSLR